MFTLKRKSDHRLQLTRTLETPGRHQLELYLFTPHDRSSAWALSEEQLFQQLLGHSFGLLGLPDQDRASKRDSGFALLSPHYEITYGAWFFQYQASLERLRQQLHGSEVPTEPVARALRLSQNFAQRLRRGVPTQSAQLRYFRQLDVYFSWRAEQFILECMSRDDFAQVEPAVREGWQLFLDQEMQYRKAQGYQSDYQGNPTRVWNRMNLYHRLLEYPVLLRASLGELGEGTRKLVKALSTTLVMSLFTLFLFNVRENGQHLSIALLLGIALVYALRDLLRDDMTSALTRWLRKGRPRWCSRLRMPYSKKVLAQQLLWLDYRRLGEVPAAVRETVGKWAIGEERQIICYRSVLTLDKAALEHNKIRERLLLDCETLCALIPKSRHQLFSPLPATSDGMPRVQAQPIERQHDYQLLLIQHSPGQPVTAQRWRIRLSASGIVQCESKGSPEARPAKLRG